MKSFFVIVSMGLILFAGGCATPDSRVKRHEAAFNSWPADVQQKVRAGQVAVGFTGEMVRVALGEPDRVATRTTAQGVSEVWVYFDKGPKFSFGLGMSSGGRHSAVGGGVLVGGDDWRDEEVLRVVFAGDRVAAVETRR